MNIYITKNEFIKCFQKDRDTAFYEFNIILEMFSGLACFQGDIDEEEFEELYNMLQKTKCKGMLFDLREDEDGGYMDDIGVSFVK